MHKKGQSGDMIFMNAPDLHFIAQFCLYGWDLGRTLSFNWMTVHGLYKLNFLGLGGYGTPGWYQKNKRQMAPKPMGS